MNHFNNTDDIVIVDYNDKQIDKASKELAHSKGLLHRAFSIYIINENKKVLLQKRNSNKYHSGGLWSNTCCSHPTSNCNLLEFASERLFQEIGIKSNLKDIGQFIYRYKFDNGLIEYEYDHILFGKVAETNINIKPNLDEVADLSWYSIEDVENALITEPESFTAWFFQSFFIFKNFLYNVQYTQ